MRRTRKFTTGVCYFNHGRKHLARLLFSLWSLRKYYHGSVTILDTGTSGGVVEKIAADERLAVEVETIPFKSLAKNSCYVAKAGLWERCPYGITILLDADTLPVKSPEPLFEICEAGDGGIVFTRFADWITTGDIMRSRIERWRGVVCKSNDERFYRGINAAELVEASLDAPHAAINTGVVAFDARSGFLRDWKRLTEEGWRCPFTDELAAQLLIRKHNHTLVDDRWNCSPIYGRNQDKAAIWHAHGSKHLKREDGRGEKGHAIWWPVVEEAWRENVGRLREWAPADDTALAFNLGKLNANG